MATLYAPPSQPSPRDYLRRAASDGPQPSPRPSSISFASASAYTPASEDNHFRIQEDSADGEELASRYQMLEELGSGSFGVVYKAIEKATGEIVAVKHVDLESSEDDLSDILSELAVLSSCASKHVTKYKLAFLRKQTLWIVMEYLGGGSCADLLKPPPHHLSESHIAIICRELLKGLAYLHGEGKLHRDIKAANVLLGMDGRVKLADFGVAAQLTGLKSVRNTFVGTPFWMAPEVIQQEGHDAKADVWSLGITAIELAMGQPPHANVHPMKVLFLIPKQPAPRLDEGDWSKEFRDFVACCLTKNEEQRPTAKQMLKHKFIRHAGKIEGLQELVQKKQEWEANRGGERNLKYYAETLKQLKVPAEEEGDDDWVFETVKAAPVRRISRNWAQRRTSSRKTSMNLCEEATAMMMDLELDRGTIRRVSGRQEIQHHEANSSVRRSGTKKRVSSTSQRQPLGVNMSFGNSPSTVRQFRRVSPNTGNENENQMMSKDEMPSPLSNNVTMMDSFSDISNSAPSTPLSSTFSSHAYANSMLQSPALSIANSSAPSTAIALESKQSQTGRSLYSIAIGLTCQNVLNETACQNKREAVSRLAEAFSDMEAVDPEGLYHIMTGIVEKISGDSTLKSLLPVSDPAPVSAPARDGLTTMEAVDEEMEYDSGTVQRTPSRAPRASVPPPNGRNASPPKLVLAQNNPHLKSHRRRQSTQVLSANSSRESSLTRSPSVMSPPLKKQSNLSPRKKELSRKELEEEELDKLIRDQTMLEHTAAMTNVLFGRWCEGLRVRWPAV